MKIQDALLALGKEGCLLLDYAELAGISVTDIILNFDRLVLNKVIRKDCFVLDADKLMKFFDKSYHVKKVNVSEVPEGQRYIALWETESKGHFVIMEGEKVVYNTLEKSYCVQYGKMNPIVRIVE